MELIKAGFRVRASCLFGLFRAPFRNLANRFNFTVFCQASVKFVVIREIRVKVFQRQDAKDALRNSGECPVDFRAAS
jgi:hypothetical protein